MKNGVWQIAAGVFIGNALFAMLAWFVASIAFDNARYDEAVASLPAAQADANASLAESCARYRDAMGSKADPKVLEGCP